MFIWIIATRLTTCLSEGKPYTLFFFVAKKNWQIRRQFIIFSDRDCVRVKARICHTFSKKGQATMSSEIIFNQLEHVYEKGALQCKKKIEN